jgi:hypothetical protein
MRQYGCDPTDAELSGFLHDKVHAFAAGYSLHEMDFQRRFGSGFDDDTEAQRYAVLADVFDAGRPLPAIAIKDNDRIADARTQRSTQVICLFALQNQLGVIAQRAGNK